MAGTKHFTRMQYHVSRGIREIVAPRQTIPHAEWKRIQDEFDNVCVFCEQPGTRENRGIIADHLIPATQFGELVLGNTVPACQSCNDSRGNRNWRAFLLERFPDEAAKRAIRIEAYLNKYPYSPLSAEDYLSPQELREYNSILADWEAIFGESETVAGTGRKEALAARLSSKCGRGARAPTSLPSVRSLPV